MGNRKESSVFRVKKSRDFSVISNAAMRDERLSFAARGVLAYLLTKPDNWKVSTKELVRQGENLTIPSKAGKTAVLRMLKELEVCGYLKRERVRNSNGNFGWKTTIYEQPCSGYPNTGNLNTKEVLNIRKPKPQLSSPSDGYKPAPGYPDVDDTDSLFGRRS